MPEALILESVNPQYHERLFIEFPEKYNFRTFCVQILFCMSKQKQKNNFCTQHVLSLSHGLDLDGNFSSYLIGRSWYNLGIFLWAEMEIILFIHFYPPKWPLGRSQRNFMNKVQKMTILKHFKWSRLATQNF